MNIEIISNIDNNFESYQRLINIYVNNSNFSFDDFRNIEIHLEGWFSANTCSLLGAILTKIKENVNNIDVITTNSNLESILESNGFLSFYGHKRISDYNNTTIAYQVLSTVDGRYFNNYVLREFLSKPDLPKMTDSLKRKLAESIYEIFNNATIHSQTENIFVCGQFFPKKNKIEFMITDLGLGIKNVVNKRFNRNLTAVQAINWAMQDRHTTKLEISGGIGLSLLYDFIEVNKGKIQVLSNDGFWQFSDGKIETGHFMYEFPGTMVNISVCTDDSNSYMSVDEVSDDIF